MQKRGKRLALAGVIVIALLTAVLIYIHQVKKDLSPELAAKSTSLLDVTPLLINKLQQITLAASDSLYHLSIDELDPSILSSQVQAFRLSLTPDSMVLARLDKARKAPDDVFTLTLDTLRITGINITDFLHKKDIRLDTVFVSAPHVRILHTSRPYNAAIRKKDSAMTLYQKLTQQFSSLSIGAIVVKEADIITTHLSQQNKTIALRHVNLQLSSIRIDSLTQYDTSRFFFSKAADFSFHDYMASSDDSMYTFSLASVSVSANQHRLVIKGLSFEPKGGKTTFQRRLKTRNDMFTVRFPDIEAEGVDWWAFVNRQSLFADKVTINGGLIKDYFDRTLPRSGKPTRKDNYPHQMLMALSMPVLIRKADVKGVDVVYEEFNPDVQQSGTISFNNISGNIDNITNVPARIKAAPQLTSSLTAHFMGKVLVTAFFGFNLAQARTGAFTARFHLGTVSNTILNPVAEPLGLYTLKSGTVDETTVSISGDNYTSVTGITMLYHDLRLVPLRVTDDRKLKSRGLVGFLANTFVIKDANPSGKDAPRHPEVPVERDKTGGSFFNFIWQSVLTGIVKTVGLPKKFADP